nr:hypothetical protein [uncultured bacterium]
MKILVTGANGFASRAVLASFLACPAAEPSMPWCRDETGI